MDDLRGSILKVQHKQSNWQGHGFASDDDVRRIMNRDSVRTALRDRDIAPKDKMEPAQIDNAVETIISRAQRIFAILVLISRTKFIRRFIESDNFQNSTLDQGLPFDRHKLRHILKDENVETQFLDQQWSFTAPILSDSIFARILPRNSILPFTKNDRLGEGSFGVVYVIAIPPSHQLFVHESSPVEFVRKEFRPRSTAKENYEQELRTLSTLKLLRHPNILQVLSCYEHCGVFNLVFPKAEGGTLKELLSGDLPERFQTEQEVTAALAGLCSAIRKVHFFISSEHDLELIGCHRDLKPANIFIQGSKFILGDFGLAKLKEASEGSDTPWRTVFPEYTPPECWRSVGDSDHPIIRRSSDVWSLGCIMAEVITYLQYGQKGVEDFYDSRKFDEGNKTRHRFHQGGKAHPMVSAWLEEREISASKTQQMLGHLLRKMLEIEPKSRLNAHEVESHMQFIAIYSACSPIQVLYDEVCQKNGSLQGILEKTRFESWKSACCLLNVDANGGWSQWEETDQYDSVQATLQGIYTELKAVVEDCQSPKSRIFHHLQQLNTILINHLGKESRVRARDYLDIQMASLAELQGLSQTKFDDANGTEADRFRMLAAIRVMTDIVQTHPSTSEAIDRKHFTSHAVIGDFEICGLPGRSSEAPRKVVVEHKTYQGHHGDQNVALELHERLSNIAALIKKANCFTENDRFRVLRCAGFYQDPTALSCGLAYYFPASAPDTTMTTLHSGLEMSQKEQRYQPALEERFQIAHIFATTVAQFHKTMWLHRSISSFNIAFFYKSKSHSGWLQGIRKPFFLGFLYSRSNEINFTEGTTENEDHRRYQHPAYLEAGKGYRQEYDYYSLGVVLLELGMWQTVRQLAQRNQPVNGRSKPLQHYLLESCVARLDLSMGRRYRQVVKRCLQGDFEVPSGAEEGNEQFAALHLKFSTLVVEQLAKCLFPCTSES